MSKDPQDISLYQPALLAVNKQIRKEALSIFYAENQFHISAEISPGKHDGPRGGSCSVGHTPTVAAIPPPLLTARPAAAFKATLDNLLGRFARDNGVDPEGRRLAHVRELRCTIDYVFPQDGFDVVETYRLFLSAYTRWGRPERIDWEVEGRLREEMDVDDDGDVIAAVVWRRKDVAKRIVAARGTMARFGGAGEGEAVMVRSDFLGGASPLSYVMDAIVSVAKYCPLATKSCVVERFFDAD